jgi:hypothetical protein
VNRGRREGRETHSDVLRSLGGWRAVTRRLLAVDDDSLSGSYAQIPLLRFAREVLQLEGPARQKALAKVRMLEQSLLTPLNDSS